jgi:hypothetical protein
MAKGRKEGLLAGIAVALRIKFGPSGLALLPEIRQIDDVSQADSPDALRELWLKA